MPVQIYLQPNFSGSGDLYTTFTYTPPASGFTPWTPSAGPVIYVSDSIGSDSYDGLSGTVDGGGVGPKKTVGAGQSAGTAGSHVLFRRGDTFPNAKFTASNFKTGTEENYTLYGGYGDSPLRPVFEIGGGSDERFIYVQANNPTGYLRFDGIHFNNYELDPNDARFDLDGTDPSRIAFQGAGHHIIFEDNIFSFMEVGFQDFGGEPEKIRPNNNTFNRNIFDSVYKKNSTTDSAGRTSNLYLSGCDNFFLNENVFDYGGWSSIVPTCGGNLYSHNIYVQDNCSDTMYFNRNIYARAASHAVHGRSGGVFDNNFSGRCAIGQGLGLNYGPLDPGDVAYVTNAVVSEGESMFKGATDFDLSYNPVGANIKTTAVYGVYSGGNDALPGVDMKVVNCVVSQLSPDWVIPNDLVASNMSLRGIDVNGHGPVSDSLVLNWDTPTQGDNPIYLEQKRTLPTYYAALDLAGDLDDLESSGYLPASPEVGYDNFDSFMKIIKFRQYGQWRDDLSAGALNNYIRAGVNKAPIPF